MRQTLRTLTALALTSCLVAGIAVGCDSVVGVAVEGASPVDAGSIAIELTLAEGLGISAILFTISGNGIEPISGSAALSADGATASAFIGQLPAGQGYFIAVAAESTDGTVACAGSASFDVSPGETTLVALTLNCRAEETGGSIGIGIVFNKCPVIERFIVAPLRVLEGASIQLSSRASDANDDELVYAWSVDPAEGSFEDAVAPDTTFTCTSAGDYQLTLEVSDGDCEVALSVGVECVVEPDCGNGIVESGEECDDGNALACDGCDASCRLEACGNGRVECSEECDGTINCDDACLQVECGDGRVNGGEECDDGNTLSCDGCSSFCLAEGCGNGRVECEEECDGSADCDAECRLFFVTTCGDGVLEEGEECDDGNLGACDGCDPFCRLEACGNGRVECDEECDGGNGIGSDGCSATCSVEVL